MHIPSIIKNGKIPLNLPQPSKFVYQFSLSFLAIASLVIGGFFVDLALGASDSINELSFSIFMLAIIVIFLGSFFWRLRQMQGLTHLKGINLETNQKIAKRVLQNLHWDSHSPEKNLLVGKSKESVNKHFLGQSLKLSVLFDGNDIWINCLAFNSMGAPDFFRYFPEGIARVDFIHAWKKELAAENETFSFNPIISKF